MKSVICALAIVLAIAATNSSASDTILTTTISGVSVRETKTGRMAMFQVQEKKRLQGVEYSVGISIVSFNNQVIDSLLSVPEGTECKLIVSEGRYQGQKQYILRKVIQNLQQQ